MSRGSTRHAQTAGDLGFAVQFNAETFRAAPLSSGQIVPRVTIGRIIPSGELHSSHVRDVKHAIAGYLRLPQPTPAPTVMPELHISTAVERCTNC